MRQVINKMVTEEDLIRTVTTAYSAGWRQVKLYFMCGLPTETDTDLAAAAGLIDRAAAMGRQLARRAGRVSASVSNFVPKPGTPFQWEAMRPAEDFARRHELVRAALRGRRGAELRFHGVGQSLLEGALARGDRRLGAVIARAWRSGARLDGWSEHFRPELWSEAFRAEGLDPAFYAQRERPTDEVLPWDHVSAGTGREHLAAERARALAGELTADCPTDPGADSCPGCGACPPAAAGVAED
jgi:radical SAM superfamily enzyme YgiQ (UPF0313 family)